MVFPGLVSMLMISILLVTFQGPSLSQWARWKRCPRIIERCRYQERDECELDKECWAGKKCCYFSCGRKCIYPRKDICGLPKDPGPCNALFRRWYYDLRRDTCLSFAYGGCEGNTNNFQNKEMCHGTCPRNRKRPTAWP